MQLLVATTDVVDGGHAILGPVLAAAHLSAARANILIVVPHLIAGALAIRWTLNEHAATIAVPFLPASTVAVLGSAPVKVGVLA